MIPGLLGPCSRGVYIIQDLSKRRVSLKEKHGEAPNKNNIDPSGFCGFRVWGSTGTALFFSYGV